MSHYRSGAMRQFLQNATQLQLFKQVPGPLPWPAGGFPVGLCAAVLTEHWGCRQGWDPGLSLRRLGVRGGGDWVRRVVGNQADPCQRAMLFYTSSQKLAVLEVTVAKALSCLGKCPAERCFSCFFVHAVMFLFFLSAVY